MTYVQVAHAKKKGKGGSGGSGGSAAVSGARTSTKEVCNLRYDLRCHHHGACAYAWRQRDDAMSVNTQTHTLLPAAVLLRRYEMVHPTARRLGRLSVSAKGAYQ